MSDDHASERDPSHEQSKEYSSPPSRPRAYLFGERFEFERLITIIENTPNVVGSFTRQRNGKRTTGPPEAARALGCCVC